jgi:2-dehydro-3-deoxygluconokinase
MVEVGLTAPGQAAVGYAGDTFNTAVYLRRLGYSVAFGGAIGRDDPFSAGILQLMSDEGVETGLVRTAPNRLPGLYAFDRDPAGERRFFYWRAEAPAREYFTLADRAALRQAVTEARLVYFSGVTLAIIGEAGRTLLGELLGEASAAGAAVAFDPNYRAQLWESAAEAQASVEAAVPHCRYISTSVADLVGIFGDQAQAEAKPAEWAARGCEVVARAEDHGVTVRSADTALELAADPPVRALDTTGAGDAFNAGYLAARLAGREPREAVRTARRLTNVVIQHVGAIVPRAAMQAVVESERDRRNA